MLELLLPLLILIAMLLLGVPIAISLGVSGVFGIFLVSGFDSVLGILQSSPHSSAANYSLLAIPMFVLMAEFLTAGNLTKELFDAGEKWVGRMPGGLAIATIFAGAGLGALSGTSTGSAATLASAAVPEMKKHGYNTSLAMGTVSISGTLAIMIPPSGSLIIYGILTEQPIDVLFLAGVIPGLITALSYCLVVIIWSKFNPKSAPIGRKSSLKEKISSLKLLWPIVLLIILTMTLIFSGIVTITEASALAAFFAFLIPLLMRRLDLKSINKAITNAIKTSTMIFTIMIGAMIFGYYLTMTQITQKLVFFVSGLSISKWLIVLILISLFIIAGFFLDQVAILFLLIPLTYPIISQLGLSPIWFGILIVKAGEIGLVSPPVGMNVFVAASAAKEKISTTFRGVYPFIISELIILIILIFIPIITTFLPDLRY